jgi:hypothetical protein
MTPLRTGASRLFGVDRTLRIVLAAILLFIAAPGKAEDADFLELAKALPDAAISLKDGLALSDFAGRPISAEYEIEGGLLLLFVLAAKEGRFTEIVFDGRSGSLEQVEPVSDADDLEDAKQQNAAMAKADISLLTALEQVEKENEGYRAVSVIPRLDGEAPVAAFVLIEGTDVRKLEKKLTLSGPPGLE